MATVIIMVRTSWLLPEHTGAKLVQPLTGKAGQVMRVSDLEGALTQPLVVQVAE